MLSFTKMLAEIETLEQDKPEMLRNFTETRLRWDLATSWDRDWEGQPCLGNNLFTTWHFFKVMCEGLLRSHCKWHLMPFRGEMSWDIDIILSATFDALQRWDELSYWDHTATDIWCRSEVRWVELLISHCKWHFYYWLNETADLCTSFSNCVFVMFQSSLQRLMETLNQANPFFIRCIKSNADKVLINH